MALSGLPLLERTEHLRRHIPGGIRLALGAEPVRRLGFFCGSRKISLKATFASKCHCCARTDNGSPVHMSVQDICVWQNGAAFGERNPWPGKYPHGLDGIARALRARGYGFIKHSFMAHVSSVAKVFQQHLEWLVRDRSDKPAKRGDSGWHGCPYPYYDLDITHPEAAAWFKDWANELVAGGLVDYLLLDFEGTSAGVLHDDTVCGPFETDRRRLGILGEALGPSPKS